MAHLSCQCTVTYRTAHATVSSGCCLCCCADRAALVNIGALVAKKLCDVHKLRIVDVRNVWHLSWGYYEQVGTIIGWRDAESGMPALIVAPEPRSATTSKGRRRGAYTLSFFKAKGACACMCAIVGVPVQRRA